MNGTSLETIFLIITFGWSDSPDNYPLTYSIQCVIGVNTFLISQGLQTFVNTFLSQGLASSNYAVSLQAAAYDVYDGISGIVITSVRVFPLGYPSSAQRRLLTSTTELNTLSRLSSLYSSLTSQAFRVSDAQKVLQIISATVIFLNSVNCTTPVDCFLLNRSPCSSTPNTCGPCISSSLIGAFGDANTLCTSSKLLRNIDAECSSNDACISFSCVNSTCYRAMKACPSNCSSNGVCRFYDHNFNSINTCYFDDPSCVAMCTCAAGFSGKFCSIPDDQIDYVVSLRDELCSSLYLSSKIQDVSPNVVLMRSVVAASILSDIRLISNEGISNCTLTLTQLINSDASATGTTDAFISLASTFSTVLDLGRNMSNDLKQSLFDAIYQLAINHQSYLTPGETGTSLFTSNLRCFVSVQLGSIRSTIQLSIPQSQQEMYLGQPTSSYDLYISSSYETFAAAIIQNSVNLVGNNTGPILQVLSTGNLFSSQSNGTANVIMQNPSPINYDAASPQGGFVTCEVSESPYNLSISCGDANPIIFTCPAGENILKLNYTCPSSYKRPECVIWDGYSFTSSPYCTVVGYSPNNVTCSCNVPIPMSSTIRRLSASSGAYAVQEFSTSVRIITRDASQTILEEKFQLVSVEHNQLVTITMGTIAGIGLLFLFTFLLYDTRNKIRLAPVFADNQCDIYSFFDALLPEIFAAKPWYLLFWTKMSLDHDWVVLFMPNGRERDHRSLRWVLAMGRLNAFLFIDTLLSSLYFNDDGTCQTYTTQSTCESNRKLDQLSNLCQWNAVHRSCSFNETVPSFYGLLISSAIITVIAIPFHGIFRYMILCLKEHSLSCGSALKINHNRLMEELNCDEELRSYETTKSKIFLTSRLTKMTSAMDQVSPEEEAECLLADKTTPWYSKEEADKINYGYVGHRAGDPLLAAKVVHGGNKDLIVKGILAARQREGDIKAVMDSLESTQERQIYLAQIFLVESLPGYRRSIVHSFFFAEFDRVLNRKSPLFILLCAFGVISYLLALPIYVLSYGGSIGSLATYTWLAIFLFVFFEDVFIFIPLNIWLKYVVISSAGSRMIRSYHDLLKRRAEVVLRRYVGLMSHANALIHHFNPACRAARTFPELPVSRLLMSLNDFDLPAVYEESSSARTSLDAILGFGSAAFTVLMFALARTQRRDR